MLNEFIQRLLMLRHFSMEKDHIELFKQDQFLIDTDFIALLEEQNPELVYALVKKNAAEKIVVYAKAMGSSPENISIDTLKSLFGSLGYGNIEILSFNREDKRMTLKLTNNPVAKAYKRMKKKASKPSCTFISGVFAGVFTKIFEKDTNCKELGCETVKGDSCTFIIE